MNNKKDTADSRSEKSTWLTFSLLLLDCASPIAIIWGIFGIALALIWIGKAPVCAQAPAVQTWFVYSNGNNTCTVKKVFQTPIKVSYVCQNPYGVEQGSYTADPVNGGAAANTFMLRAGSTDQSASSLTCIIAMNGTQNPVTMGSLGTVAASSAEYSCSGIANGSISWP